MHELGNRNADARAPRWTRRHCNVVLHLDFIFELGVCTRSCDLSICFCIPFPFYFSHRRTPPAPPYSCHHLTLSLSLMPASSRDHATRAHERLHFRARYTVRRALCGSDHDSAARLRRCVHESLKLLYFRLVISDCFYPTSGLKYQAARIENFERALGIPSTIRNANLPGLLRCMAPPTYTGTS